MQLLLVAGADAPNFQTRSVEGAGSGLSCSGMHRACPTVDAEAQGAVSQPRGSRSRCPQGLTQWRSRVPRGVGAAARSRALCWSEAAGKVAPSASGHGLLSWPRPQCGLQSRQTRVT